MDGTKYGQIDGKINTWIERISVCAFLDDAQTANIDVGSFRYETQVPDQSLRKPVISSWFFLCVLASSARGTRVRHSSEFCRLTSAFDFSISDANLSRSFGVSWLADRAMPFTSLPDAADDLLTSSHNSLWTTWLQKSRQSPAILTARCISFQLLVTDQFRSA